MNFRYGHPFPGPLYSVPRQTEIDLDSPVLKFSKEFPELNTVGFVENFAPDSLLLYWDRNWARSVASVVKLFTIVSYEVL
jgi:hypothetical protein